MVCELGTVDVHELIGSRLSPDGQVFLRYARTALAALEQAEQSVRPGGRPWRVDVLNRRIAPARAVERFYGGRPDANLDVVTLADSDAGQAAAAVLDGTVDASFRALPAERVPAGVRAERLLDTPLQLLVGSAHPLAGATWVRPADLAGPRIRIPGIRPGTEWAEFYRALSAAFALDVDASGPHFGDEALLDDLAGSDSLATLVGADDRYLWPDGHDLRRIPLHRPTPVYPHVLLAREADRHRLLTALRRHLRETGPPAPGDVWLPPDWAGS